MECDDVKQDLNDLSAEQTQQKARAQLRESFLKAIMDLNDKPCNILTYENTTLKATFAGWQPDGSEILAKDLETPACIKMFTALLRTPDILAITFNSVDLL